jgi:hypothetical protein
MTIAHGFTYELVHGEDFDPRCDVCTTSTDIIHKILGDWMEEAIFVESQADNKYVDQKRMVILKPSDKPMVERIGGWFVELFDETIKLAAVDKILFRDIDTENVYEFIITY